MRNATANTFGIITASLMLALSSAVVIQPVEQPIDLGELVLKAGEEAKAYHEANDPKPVALTYDHVATDKAVKKFKQVNHMTPEQQHKAIAYLFAGRD